MRHTLLALIILTQLDGQPIRVDSNQVNILKGANPNDTLCKHGHGSSISIAGRGMCVRETPEEICAKVEKFGGRCEEVTR